MSRVDDPDSELLRRHENRRDVTAAQREDLLHSVSLEKRCYSLHKRLTSSNWEFSEASNLENGSDKLSTVALRLLVHLHGV